MDIVRFLICHRLGDIHNRIVHELNLDLKNGPRSNVNMSIESQYMPV